MNPLPLFLLATLCTTLSFADDQVPRDNSYTVSNALQKLQKDYPGIEAASDEVPPGVEKRSAVVYRQASGRALRADVFYPSEPHSKGYPGVLLVHGGGWRSGTPSLLHPLAQQLAARGYVTVTPEYRLSLEAPYPAAVRDLKTAIKWMRSEKETYRIRTDSIAILGCSAGGQLAALVGTTHDLAKLESDDSALSRYSSAVQAIIDIDGVLAFKHPESEEGAVAAQWLGGSFKEIPKIWEEASALTHVDQKTPPMLFLGSAYPRFHAGKNDVIKMLKTYGIHHETYVFDNAPHSFWLFHPWFDPTLEYIDIFLKTVNAL